jgi:hypothetical protein
MKISIIALGMFAFCAGVKSQTVTVADVDALPGETVAFTLDLTGGKANTYTAMQFDAQFPVTGFSTTGQYSVSDLWMNATATVGSVNVDGIATIPVASSESISASDVKGLFSVSFTVDGNVAVGDYDVTLKNLWFGYGTSSKDYLADVTFTVHVVNVHSVVLDENSTTVPESAEGVNVTVKRTISAGSWNTICLPFAMTEAQCKAAFGDDVQLADFSAWSSEEDDDGNIVKLEVDFADVTEIEANHPYIIKVSTDMTEFSVDGVDIAAEEEPTVQVGKKKAERGYFIGTYTANTEVPADNLFLSGNKFWYSSGLTQMNGFRGYFELADVLTEAEESGARITVRIDGSPMDVKVLKSNTPLDGIYYDLSGRRVEKPGKGYYIVNGKIFFK